MKSSDGFTTSLTAYNDKGELTQQSGARTYPVSYTYTSQGRPETMKTYRNGLGGSADTTTWAYDSQRGWTTSKTYSDSSAVSYEYFDNGALKKRSWARGIDTEYSYDAGESLTNVNYSGSTADISYTLDRLGRATEIIDAAGTWTNTYCTDGQLDTVTLPQISGGVLEYSRDVLGRLTNSSLSIGGAQSFATAYSFDNAGRLSSVSDGTRTATYAYSPDGTIWTNLSFGAALNTHRTFDGLNRLSEISSAPSASSAVSFSYTYNSADQRTTNTLADGSYWLYTYDSLGQVISGKKYFSDGIPVGGCQFEYDFDTIGNRETAKNFKGSSTKTSTYTANNLNQYSQRTVPGEIFVTGTASNQATVTMREGTNTATQANRHSDYFWQALDVDNSSTIFSTTNLQIRAYMTQVQGTNTNSLVRTEVKKTIVPKTPENFTYDSDGNLISDGLWTNQWNAENRLTCVESQSGVPDSKKVKVDYVYDYQGRRVEKTAYSDYDGTNYGITNITKFIYDGWNMVAEISDEGYTNYYTYGLDISGSLGGAGGVGGLFSKTTVTVSDTNTYFYLYDGNANVVGMVDETESTVASYEYSPFGETIKATGVQANSNAFRFSTHYFDTETGLYNGKKRYYSPPLGRYLSRDPIEEDGGVALYVYCGNQPVGRLDAFGEEWHYDRDKGPRATVWFDAPGDTVVDLARIVQLDASQVNRWLKDAQGNRVSNPKICEKYTVPNVALVAVGTSRSTLDPTGLLTRPYLLIHSVSTLTAFQARDFQTVLLDAAYGGLSSATLMSYANDDLWGMALFGHGKDGDLVLEVGFFPWIINDYIASYHMNPGHKIGAEIVYFCDADQGDWADLVSRNGKFRGTRGLVSILAGPRALTPAHWGSWDSLIGLMTPPERR